MKIPGALGVQENEVPLIYLMIAALVVRESFCCYWYWRLGVFAR